MSCEQPGQWVRISRTFRDGSTQDWWALEVVAGPYGARHRWNGPWWPPPIHRRCLMPPPGTWSPTCLLPPSARQRNNGSLPASLEEVIRLYGLRMWVEQSYKQVKHTLGWSQYQVRSDTSHSAALAVGLLRFLLLLVSRRSSHLQANGRGTGDSEPEASPPTSVPADAAGTGEKNQRGTKSATTPVLAGSPSGGARMVGAVDHAAALLASVVRAAPTSSAPMLA